MPKLTTPGKAPAVTTKQRTLESFKGLDLTNELVQVAEYRSPDAPNMMPGPDGFPKKRPGFDLYKKYDGCIYGAYVLDYNQTKKQLIHAGTKLYDGDTVLYEDMAEGTSVAVQLKGKLWILDGKTYLYYDGEKVEPVAEIATVPVIAISRAPDGKGGAESYKPVNMLTGKRTDSFLGTAGTTVYVLSFNELSAAAVTAQVLNAAGEWQDKAETADFTVERDLGRVTFNTAPGVSPVAGEDNVRITYEITENKADVINKCRFSILYGVNGALDRVFLSGNPDEPNTDYWTEWQDPAYVGDLYYSVLGQEASPIVGYSVLNNQLVTHKLNEENGRNVFLRKGELDDDGFPLFPITNIVQGEGAFAPLSFASFGGEPVYLGHEGVYALAPNDLTGERYVQMRSYYLNGRIKREKNMQDAAATVFGRFYALALNGKLYLLDVEQKSYENKNLFSNFSYEGYMWLDVPAKRLWVWDRVLYFGTADGHVCFFNSGDSSGEYSDYNLTFNEAQPESEENPKRLPIKCWWTTPLMNLDTWSNLKTVTGVWVVAHPDSRSSGDIYYASDKEYEKFIKDYTVDIFDFADIDFNRFTFNAMDRPGITPTGKKAKKVKLFQVKVKNEAINESFGIYAISINYRIGGRIKR